MIDFVEMSSNQEQRSIEKVLSALEFSEVDLSDDALLNMLEDPIKSQAIQIASIASDSRK